MANSNHNFSYSTQVNHYSTQTINGRLYRVAVFEKHSPRSIAELVSTVPDSDSHQDSVSTDHSDYYIDPTFDNTNSPGGNLTRATVSNPNDQIHSHANLYDSEKETSPKHVQEIVETKSKPSEDQQIDSRMPRAIPQSVRAERPNDRRIEPSAHPSETAPLVPKEPKKWECWDSLCALFFSKKKGKNILLANQLVRQNRHNFV